MRYIGNKTKLLDKLERLLVKKGLTKKGMIFCDLFAGTCTVGDYFKDRYEIIANDTLYTSYVISNAKLKYKNTFFQNLGFDPFDYFNNIDSSNYTTGFCYNNFAPTVSGRQYFSDENAKLIDLIRNTIDEWFDTKKIDENEKYYLIGSLLESVSKVSNVAGVYSAYLKIWDPRAIKKMEFIPIETSSSNSKYLNEVYIEDVNDLKCVFVDGESVSATVKGSKSDKDIAVVAINLSDIKDSTINSIAIAELADSDDVAIGQEVVAIGNALGEGQSVTNGIISATNRSITVNNVTFSGLLMTNAAINSGNSGGALLNAEGKVIAINFAKTSSDGVEGMAYSIPVSNVMDIIDSLMSRETRSKVSSSETAYLGISGVDITSAMSSSYGYPQGVLIRSVENNSAAAQAGLGAYDIIVSFDDQSVNSMSSLKSIMEYYAAGEKVTVQYYHQEGSEYVLKSVEVTLGKKS